MHGHFWLIMILLACVSQLVIIIDVSTNKGADPSWLVNGRDYLGNSCEDKVNVWPSTWDFYIRICEDDCAYTNTVDSANTKMLWGNAESCYYETEMWMDAFCFPTDASNVNLDGDSEAGESFNRAVGDLVITKWALVVSMFLAAAISFAYVYSLNFCGGCLVWGSVIIAAIGGLFIGWSLMQKAAEVEDDGYENTATGMWTLGALIIFFDIVFMIGLIFMRKKIRLAINIIKEAGQAFVAMPYLLFFPGVTFVLALGYFIFWLFVTLFIFSVEIESDKEFPTTDYTTVDTDCPHNEWSDVFPETHYKEYSWDWEMENTMWYHLFVGLWWLNFILYWSFTVLAGAFADWYFSQPADTDGTTPPKEGGLCASIWRTTRYHLGSIAFGALIIAIIQFIRAVLYYIEKKCMDSENVILRCIMCCIQCCLKCLECCIDKINKHAFVFMSVFGTPFCPSAFKAFNVILDHLATVGILGIISTYIEWIGKLTIAILSTGLMMFAISNFGIYEDNEISSYTVVALALLVICT
eukprot:UN30038